MKKAQEKRTKRFITGVVLIVVSIVFGWPVLPVGGFLALIYGRFWLVLGGCIYAISWVVLGLGVLMAGPAGIKFIKDGARRMFKRCGR